MKRINGIWRKIACAGLVLTIGSGLGLPISAVAATTGRCGSCKMKTAKGDLKQLKAMHEKLLSDAKADDAALEKMVAELNQAPESKKVDLEAAILAKLVEQHHQMLGEWESMHPKMMHSNQRMELGKNRAPAAGNDTSTAQR